MKFLKNIKTISKYVFLQFALVLGNYKTRLKIKEKYFVV